MYVNAANNSEPTVPFEDDFCIFLPPVYEKIGDNVVTGCTWLYYIAQCYFLVMSRASVPHCSGAVAHISIASIEGIRAFPVLLVHTGKGFPVASVFINPSKDPAEPRKKTSCKPTFL